MAGDSDEAGNRPLRLNEAVSLAGVLVAVIAKSMGIRVLIIKGDSLAAHGLRDPKPSMDVDVLVDPASIGDLSQALGQQGWVSRQERFPSQWDAPHSLTLVHDLWPCDIDLHRFFPGFLAEPLATFDTLWSRRSTMQIAHQPCPIPDRASSALILALNDLRGGVDGHLASATIEPERLGLSAEHLEDLILETGCELTLRSVYGSWGLNVSANSIPREEVRARFVRALSGKHGRFAWKCALRDAGMVDHVRVAPTVARYAINAILRRWPWPSRSRSERS